MKRIRTSKRHGRKTTVREFPGYGVRRTSEQIAIYPPAADKPVVRAVKVPLKTEVVSLTPEFTANLPSALLKPHKGEIHVLTSETRTDGEKDLASQAYQIVQSGTLTHEGLTYSFEKGRLYNAPYGRFRFLDVEDLPPEIRGDASAAKPQPAGLKGIARGSAEVIEKKTIIETLEKTRGNVTQAAKILGVSRATLQNKMKAYALRAKPTV